MGAVLTGISIACIALGVALLVVQLRHRPTHPVPSPSGNGAEPPDRAMARAAPPARLEASASRGEAARRRRVLSALLVAMIATLAAALVVQERWVWGVHLFVDDAFLGYVAWLARRAEARARTAAPTLDAEPAVEARPKGRRSTAVSAEVEERDEAEVTDARA